MVRKKKYDYMIKTVQQEDGKLLAYNNFEYPKEKGVLVVPQT